LNAELVDQEIVVYEPVNLGMAVAVPDGLIVVVVPDADKKSVTEMQSSVNDLVGRARANKLTYKDIEGSTFTVSNLGMYGIDVALPIPRRPEGAILVIGRGHAVPAVVSGEIVIRDMAWFSLTFDHRFIDGATAASFLADLQKNLEAHTF
jgi:pyruvate dehydrogenase E2 component (dihydrolipoamide acetyltransferase)